MHNEDQNQRQEHFLESPSNIHTIPDVSPIDKLDGFIAGEKKDEEDGSFQPFVESLSQEAEHEYLSENQDKNMKTNIDQMHLIKS